MKEGVDRVRSHKMATGQTDGLRSRSDTDDFPKGNIRNIDAKLPHYGQEQGAGVAEPMTNW